MFDFKQYEFVQFLDSYKNKLMATDNMLKESKTNYRVKKLAVFYGLKNHETFYEFYSSALGREYLQIAKYVLKNIKAHPKYGTEAITTVAESLLEKYFLNANTPFIEEKNDPKMLTGYYKFLFDFTGEKKFEQLEKELDLEVDMDKVGVIT